MLALSLALGAALAWGSAYRVHRHDPGQLRVVLERVRDKGYVVTQRDVRVPIASVAAPIFGAGRKLIAAFTLMSDVGAFLKKKDALLDIVLHSTSVISAAMGRSRSGAGLPVGFGFGRRVQLGTKTDREFASRQGWTCVHVAPFIRTE